MNRNTILGFAACFLVAVQSLVAQAQTFFSPSQAQLSSFVFADYWPGNGAALTNTTLVGGDGVQYTFNTGFATPRDAFSRSQWTMPFTQDLTGYQNVGLAFQVPPGGSVNGNQLFAQLDVHYNGGASFAGSDWVPINATGRTNVYLPLNLIPPAQLSQLTSIDIELRSNDPIEGDIGDRVNVFTAPAPPSYLDGYQISDFEGNDPAAWGPSFQPDHEHSIVMADGSEFNNGVTKGTHALQIVRTFTGENFPATANPPNINFRFASQMSLAPGGGAVQGDYTNNGRVDAADYTRWRDNFGSTTANLPNDPTPTNVNQADYNTWKTNFGQTAAAPDPVIQAKVSALVDAINAAGPDGRIAFDVSFNNPDAFPDANPGFLGFEMSIQDTAGFYQTSFGFPNVPAVGQFYKGLTLAVPISAFRLQGQLPTDPPKFLGTTPLLKNGYLTFGLASNTDGNATFSIDNIRVQTLAPPAGFGSESAVPEPSTLLAAVVSLSFAMIVRRRSS